MLMLWGTPSLKFVVVCAPCNLIGMHIRHSVHYMNKKTCNVDQMQKLCKNSIEIYTGITENSKISLMKTIITKY